MYLSLTFQEWAVNIFSIIPHFVYWLKTIAESLMSNYIYVTLICVTLSISLIWLIYYLVFDTANRYIKRYDDYMTKYDDYKLYKDVQTDYLKSHRDKIYDYLYDYYILRNQVYYSIYQNHPDLLLANKVENLKLNAKAFRIYHDLIKSDDDPKNDDDINYISPFNFIKSNKYNEKKYKWLDELENEVNSFNHKNNSLDNRYYYSPTFLRNEQKNTELQDFVNEVESEINDKDFKESYSDLQDSVVFYTEDGNFYSIPQKDLINIYNSPITPKYVKDDLFDNFEHNSKDIIKLKDGRYVNTVTGEVFGDKK